MNLYRGAMALIGCAIFSVAAAAADEIYTGEPLAEARHDLKRCAELVSHELSSVSAKARTDVFRLKDGRLVAVTSRASKGGDNFTIEALRVTSTPRAALNKRLPTVSSVSLPK